MGAEDSCLVPGKPQAVEERLEGGFCRDEAQFIFISSQIVKRAPDTVEQDVARAQNQHSLSVARGLQSFLCFGAGIGAEDNSLGLKSGE